MKKLFMTVLLVGFTGFTIADGANLLLEAVENGNEEMVEKLLREKGYTPKQLRGVLKVAYKVAAEKSSEKRTMWEWIKMVSGSAFAVSYAGKCFSYFNNDDYALGVVSGLFAAWLGRAAYRGWYAPYDRYDRSIQISDALKAALSTQSVSGAVPAPAR